MNGVTSVVGGHHALDLRRCLSLRLCQERRNRSLRKDRDERVQVILKNGHSLIGIAKQGIRCERLVRGNFKPSSDAPDRSAGIRVWYYQDLDGYIFLESKGLDRVDVLGTLTAEESRALAEAVAAARRFPRPGRGCDQALRKETRGDLRQPACVGCERAHGRREGAPRSFPAGQGLEPREVRRAAAAQDRAPREPECGGAGIRRRLPGVPGRVEEVARGPAGRRAEGRRGAAAEQPQEEIVRRPAKAGGPRAPDILRL